MIQAPTEDVPLYQTNRRKRAQSTLSNEPPKTSEFVIEKVPPAEKSPLSQTSTPVVDSSSTDSGVPQDGNSISQSIQSTAQPASQVDLQEPTPPSTATPVTATTLKSDPVSASNPTTSEPAPAPVSKSASSPAPAPTLARVDGTSAESLQIPHSPIPAQLLNVSKTPLPKELLATSSTDKCRVLVPTLVETLRGMRVDLIACGYWHSIAVVFSCEQSHSFSLQYFYAGANASLAHLQSNEVAAQPTASPVSTSSQDSVPRVEPTTPTPVPSTRLRSPSSAPSVAKPAPVSPTSRTVTLQAPPISANADYEQLEEKWLKLLQQTPWTKLYARVVCICNVL